MRPDVMKFLSSMNEKFGKNTLRPASELTSLLETRISTGSISLDIATGGGIPFGRFVQISGDFSSGKSTLAYHMIHNVQQMVKQIPIVKKKGKEGEVEWIDKPMLAMLIQSESDAYTPEYGESLGIDNDELIFNPCAGMEEALEIAHRAQEEGIVDLIVFDSLESMIPMKEYDSGMEDTVQMGIKPKLFAEYFRKFQAANNKLRRQDMLPCTVIGLNQLRERIGAYGNPEFTPGGRAITFTASLDIRLRKGESIAIGTGKNKTIIGNEIKFKVNKNKVGAPMKTGRFELYTDDGGVVPKGHIDNFKEVIIEGIAYGVIKRGGAWISYKNLKAQGAENFVELLRNYPAVTAEIREELMSVALSEDADKNVEEDDE